MRAVQAPKLTLQGHAPVIESSRMSAARHVSHRAAATQLLRAHGFTGVGSKAWAFGALLHVVHVTHPPAASLTLRPAAPPRRSCTTACAAACFCARCTARAALPVSTCSWSAAADCEQTGAERVRGGGGAEAKGEGAVHTQLQEVSGRWTRGGE